MINIKVCINCKKEIYGMEIHNHHICYKTNTLIPLCSTCHRLIHCDKTHLLHPINYMIKKETENNIAIDLNKLKDEGKFKRCQYCDKVFQGLTANQVDYFLEQHIVAKHKLREKVN